MAENPSSGVCTRHIDTWYYFICDHEEDGFIKIIFVRKNENNTNIFTGNVNKDLRILLLLNGERYEECQRGSSLHSMKIQIKYDLGGT
jgi:hypothetical protein